MPTLPGLRGSRSLGAFVSVSWMRIARGTGPEANRRLKVRALPVVGRREGFRVLGGQLIRKFRPAAAVAAAVLASLCFVAAASAKPILMSTLAKSTEQQKAARAINPPA